MDSWKSHLFLGVSVEIPFILLMFFWKQWFQTYTLLYSIQICIIIFISPLLLDLDHRHGKLREGLTFLGLMIGLLGVLGYYTDINLEKLMVFGILISILSYMPIYLTKHRGFLHSLSFIGLYSVGIYFITTELHLTILGFLGAYTHLLGDKLFFKII